MRYLLRVMILIFLSLVLLSCVSNKQYNRAILHLESAWKEANDRILDSEGRRFFKATKHQGFVAVELAVRRIGMVVEQQSYETGFLLVTAPAPVPLTMSDWAVVQKSDTQEMRSIIAEDVGVASWFVTLDPSAKDVMANIFITEKGDGVEISIGLRLRNRKVEADRNRRMQPPPSAVLMGLRKLWSVLEQELNSVIDKGAALGPEAVAYTFAQKSMSLPKDAMNGVTQSPDNLSAVAVIIGNKNYRNRIPQVDFAHNDADAMKRFLIEILGVHEGNIIDLRDVKLVEMESVLGNDRTYKAKLWQYVRPRESDVFIFYSGHGVPGLKDGRQYLLPVDGDPNEAEIQGYPIDLLYKNLSQLETRSMTVFIDACFSGESQNESLVRAASGIHVTSKNLPAVPFTVISAANKDQVASWDKESRHGLFTKYLLNALYGAADNNRYGNADNQITLGEIKGYLDREMTYAARREFGREQQATVNGDPEKVIVILNR